MVEGQIKKHFEDDEVIYLPGSLDQYEGDTELQSSEMQRYIAQVMGVTGLSEVAIHDKGPEEIARLLKESGFLLATYEQQLRAEMFQETMREYRANLEQKKLAK